jgi:hypothetical protein
VSSKLPTYIGHPPSHLPSPVVAVTHGFEGLLSHVHLHNTALKPSEVKALLNAQKELLSTQNGVIDEVSVINIFGILRKSLDSLDNLSDTSLRRAFNNSGLLDALFDLFRFGSSTIKCSAYHIAASLLPPMDIELVNGLAFRHGLVSDQSQSFSSYLLSSVGESINKIARRAESTANSVSSLLEESSADQVAVISAQVKLLRSFASGHHSWVNEVTKLVTEMLAGANDLIAMLDEYKKQEMSLPLADTLAWEKMPSVSFLKKTDSVFGALALLGYEVTGLYPGATVTYTDVQSGASEEAVVIGVTKPPFIEKDSKGKNKELVDKWCHITTAYGEAICIALHSQPHQTVVVPRSYVKPITNAKLSPKFEEFIVNTVGIDKLVALFKAISDIDLLDKRARPLPVVKVEDKTFTYESKHPYDDNQDIYEEINLPGAEEMTIVFDESSQTETNCDYVQFFKTSAKAEIYDKRYTGRNGDQNFPGCGGRDPLKIPSGFALMHFHSDGSNTVSTHCLT